MATTHITRRIDAPAHQVFDAWLDASKLRAWMFTPPWGGALRIRVDARVGGAFSFVERLDGEDREIRGEYFEIVRPRRLACTWTASGEEQRVTVEVRQLARGCELRVTHVAAQDATATWTRRLDSLAQALAASELRHAGSSQSSACQRLIAL